MFANCRISRTSNENWRKHFAIAQESIRAQLELTGNRAAQSVGELDGAVVVALANEVGQNQLRCSFNANERVAVAFLIAVAKTVGRGAFARNERPQLIDFNITDRDGPNCGVEKPGAVLASTHQGAD